MTTPSWDDAYTGSTPAAWDIGRPQPAFVRLAEQGLLSGRLLDYLLESFQAPGRGSLTPAPSAAATYRALLQSTRRPAAADPGSFEDE